MQTVNNLNELQALYGAAVPAALKKVATKVTPLYKQWIDAARFTVVSTVGPEGTDVSPRGDEGSVVSIVDDQTLWLPDWRGNNRIDSLKNIVVDGRISLMFMVPTSNNVVRVNGNAVLTTDSDVTATFMKANKTPRTVIVITVREVYFQCAKALMRSALWAPQQDARNLPTAGTVFTRSAIIVRCCCLR